MSIWGMIIGGAAGAALGGPIGALIGAAAGIAFDHSHVDCHAIYRSERGLDVDLVTSF